MGHGFTFGGQELGSVGAAVCKIQATKRYIKSLPSTLRNKKTASLKAKVGCTAECTLPSGSTRDSHMPHVEAFATRIKIESSDRISFRLINGLRTHGFDF